ncbi:MAG: hypothetical protein ABEJ46_03240, partial [Gemmatimonadota bacterium]
LLDDMEEEQQQAVLRTRNAKLRQENEELRAKLEQLQDQLREKGIDEATAEEAIEAAFREAGVSERDLLERAAEKKWESLEGEDPVRERRRFRSYLSRRGFPWPLIRDVESRYFGEQLYRDEYPDDAGPAADDVPEHDPGDR